MAAPLTHFRLFLGKKRDICYRSLLEVCSCALLKALDNSRLRDCKINFLMFFQDGRQVVAMAMPIFNRLLGYNILHHI